MVFDTTFNNILVISWRQFYWWRKPKYPGENHLPQVTDKLSHTVVSSTSRHESNTQAILDTRLKRLQKKKKKKKTAQKDE